MGYKRHHVFYELLKPNQIITVELLSTINQFKCSIIAQRKRKMILLHDHTLQK